MYRYRDEGKSLPRINGKGLDGLGIDIRKGCGSIAAINVRRKCIPLIIRSPFDTIVPVSIGCPAYTLYFASKNFLSHPRVTSCISISFHVSGLQISYFTCRVNLTHVCRGAIRSTIYQLSLMRDCKI